MKTTLLIALLALSSAAQGLAETLRKGILEEESKQNLNGAIQAYQSVLTQFDSQRKIAATALFRMAESYRKLGKNAEATAAYSRLVREFPDQGKLVEQSRTHLPATYKAGPEQAAQEHEAAAQAQLAVQRAAWARYRKLKEEEIKVLEEQISIVQRRVERGSAIPDQVLSLKMELLRLQQAIAAFDAGNPPK